MPMLRAVALTVLVVLLVPGASDARIYRWVDASGTPHFSDRVEEVPPQFRDQVEEQGEGDARFVVVPGIGQPAEGQPVQPVDEVAFEAEALAALEGMRGDKRGMLLNLLREKAGTMLPALIGGGLLALLLFAAFGALLLLVACRICGEDSPGFLKGTGIVALQMIASLAIAVLLGLLVGTQPQLGVQVSQFGLGVGVQAGILRGLHSESFLRALGVTAVSMVLSLAVGVVIVLFAFCAGVGAGLAGAS